MDADNQTLAPYKLPDKFVILCFKRKWLEVLQTKSVTL